MKAWIFSPFGMARIVLRSIRSATKWLVVEIRPIFLPHPPEELTKQFTSLLPHLSMCVVGDDEDAVRSRADPALLTILADLEARDDKSYEGNAYRELAGAGFLPQHGPWSLVAGTAECTPHDETSNRTRWTLQMLLVQYILHYGQPSMNDSFLYVWHDVAFQFAGQSRTIGKLAWAGIQLVPANKYGARFACGMIELTNQPDGTIPWAGVPIRTTFDIGSRLFYDFF